jgi:tryptophan synthase alpha chain
MNRLTARFRELRTAGQAALLPYLTAGYPDPETTIELLRRVDPQRCACVELGFPFSDPIADGPVIQTSFYRALDAGFRVPAFLDALRGARGSIALPLVAMVSYSIVYRRGAGEFLRAATAAGIDGLIVPDLSIEEADALAQEARSAGCPLVMMVAPTTSPRRCETIVRLSEPFIYYQSVAGVTGERGAVATDVAAHVAELRTMSGKPVCVGFGISTPAHVSDVCRIADGAIVGSAIVKRMNAAVERGAKRDELVADVMGFIDSLAAAVPR